MVWHNSAQSISSISSVLGDASLNVLNPEGGVFMAVRSGTANVALLAGEGGERVAQVQVKIARELKEKIEFKCRYKSMTLPRLSSCNHRQSHLSRTFQQLNCFMYE
jgi:hypothetical protein